MAFETYMISEEVENLVTGDETSGFRVPIRIPYYRGIVISLIEDFEVTVDGTQFPREAVSFTLRDRTMTLDEVGVDGRTRWEFGEWAALDIAKPGGLDPGEHEVEITGQFRISYLPWPMRPEASKRVTVR